MLDIYVSASSAMMKTKGISAHVQSPRTKNAPGFINHEVKQRNVP